MNDLLREIEAHFYLESPPKLPLGDEFHDDSLDDIEVLRGKNWNTISIKCFNDNPWIFTSLPMTAVPYYLGAYMTRSIIECTFMSESFKYLIFTPHSVKHVKDATGAMVLRGALHIRQINIFVSYLRFVVSQTNELDSEEIHRFISVLSSGPATNN